MFRVNPTIKLTKPKIEQLKELGFNTPKKAVSYDYDFFMEDGKGIEICTFFNGDDLPIKRLKVASSIAEDKKEVQARFYHYLGEKGEKRKLKEINQYHFNSNNECTGATNWRFYHTKKGEIRFSMESGETKKNNFLQSDGAITDKNGFKIRPISIAEYLDIKHKMGRKHFVDEPWTPKESITSKYGVTDSVQECTLVGIVGEKGISLNHFNPNNAANQKTDILENTLTKQLVQQGKNAKAILIGSCEQDRASNAQFELLDDYFAVRNIPHSKYKTGDNVLYSDFGPVTKIKLNDSKKIKYGEVTPFYYQSGQHFAYENGEIKLTNVVIDDELSKGNTDSKTLIHKSFKRHT